MSEAARKGIVEVAEAEQRRVSADPNVTGVGYGLRVRAGRIEYQACLKYYVRQKIADEQAIRAAGSAMIPLVVEGYPTDVMEEIVAYLHKAEGPPTGSRGSHVENPLIGGTSTSVLSDWHSFPTGGFGTIGGICFDVNSSAAMAISNAHVWGTDTGKNCIQPWTPVGDYLTALLKLVTCGPFAFPLDVTAPSPLTTGLAAAAAGAWVAAALSDAEDPSRWGQRTGTVPPLGALTTADNVHVSAPLPDMPFAGRAYSTKARWDYTRHTTAGSSSISIETARPNEHVLYGKLVWTDHLNYKPGARVHICAEVVSGLTSPNQYFVVAKCFPNTDPRRVVYRVLTPGRCKHERPQPICAQDFPDPLPHMVGTDFLVCLDRFWFESGEELRSVTPPPNPPAAGRPLALPKTSLRVIFPPGNRVTFQFGGLKSTLQIMARSSAGVQVATATTHGQADLVILEAAEMVEAVISGAHGEGELYSVCVTKAPYVQVPAAAVGRLSYTGFLDLDLAEKKGRWSIMLSVQSLNPSLVDADPIESARILSGVESGASILAGACIAVMLLDHVFDVI